MRVAAYKDDYPLVTPNHVAVVVVVVGNGVADIDKVVVESDDQK